MKHIANILTSDPFSASELYNVTAERDSLIPGIPTLVIGWERAKEEYPDASIIEWKLADDVYWTYGKYERREKYEENLKKFSELAVKNLIDSISYTYYDVILLGDGKFNSFINMLMDDSKKTVYAPGDMLYVYFEELRPHSIIGLSLRDCDYLGPEYKKRLFSTLYNKENINILKNNSEISREVRYKLKNREYMLPYIFS